jgi:hypothetical protein
VDVPAWPQDGLVGAAPNLRVWWLPNRQGPGLALKPGLDFRAIDDLQGKQVQVRGDSVTIDSVTVEQRWVPTSSAAAGHLRGQRWCLVVRATHPVDRPIRVRPEGLTDLAGQEHRFYPRAGRYVGLFWFVNVDSAGQVEDRVDRGLSSFNVISVPALKKEAGGMQYVADFSNLDNPNATPRPRAPLQRD